MTVPKIDWVVMWKLFHFQFFWIYATLGVLLRVVLMRSFKMVQSRQTRLYIGMSSFASSLLCTWFPVFPIILVGMLMLAVRDARGRAIGESLLISGPLVVVSIGMETAIVDAVLMHWLLRQSGKRKLVRLFVMNMMNAVIALAVGLAWAFRHPPNFVAALDNFR